MSKKSLYTEIIEEAESYLESSQTDGHYTGKCFTTQRGAVYHALSSIIGQMKAIKEGRDWDKMQANKKRRKKK